MAWILWHFELHTWHGMPDMVDQALIDSTPLPWDIITDHATSLAITYENIRRSNLRDLNRCLAIWDQLARLDNLTPHYMWYLENKLSENEACVFGHMVNFIRPITSRDLAPTISIKRSSLPMLFKRLVEKQIITNTEKWVYAINNEDNNFLAFCIMRFNSNFRRLMRQVPKWTENPVDYIIDNQINLTRYQ